jgi:ice-binding like protein/stigma-specific protein Stig1
LLGTAKNFAVLGGSTVTNTGPSSLGGDLGVSPGAAITGFPPGNVTGETHKADAVALQAQSDVTAAYVDLAGRKCDVVLTGTDLGGLKLKKGVYCFASSAQLTGTLTLDAENDPDAVFIFQIGSALTTASNSSVVIVQGAGECRVFWQIGSSATLGTDTAFTGNILALTSISLLTRANLAGRALARNGAVTLDSNRISPSSCENVCTRPDAEAGTCCLDTVCGASCTDTNSDRDNCGACGKACAKNESCNAGSCSACSHTMCGGSCVDLESDAANCGACGRACNAGDTCVGGLCGSCCTNGNTICQGVGGAENSCVNFKWDPNNCGACGNRCTATEMCTDSSCKPCLAGMQCDGFCPDMNNDPNNCGACGKTCAPSESCVKGSCGACDGTVCGGVCTELRTDPNNCGACGTVCAPGECCVGGACTGTVPTAASSPPVSRASCRSAY